MLALDREICQDFDRALSREWLETNGLGGFASATITGANTRRYHGLLTAATQPPVGRMVLLSKLEEIVFIGETPYELSTNEYRGAIHPQGYRWQVSFALDPWPVSVFEFSGVRLQRSIFMVHGSNTTVIEYKLLRSPRGQALRMEVRPLIAFREYHNTTHENSALRPDYITRQGLICLRPYDGCPDLFLSHNARAVESQSYWYRSFLYRMENERGLDDLEDLFNPLVLHFDLAKEQAAVVIASTEEVPITELTALRRKEQQRRRKLTVALPAESEYLNRLARAADQFLVSRGGGATVIAGYPWFADWGRDTMVSLPGLALCTGRPDLARSILLEAARHVDRGMLPNCFHDHGDPEFNTADATLFFVEAVRAYAASTADWRTVRDDLYPVLVDIMDWHRRGTRFGIAADLDGLLHAGEPGLQLTWMDARVGDWVVTPRAGKPVEIQALWYNALRILEVLARRFNEPERASGYGTLAEQARDSFNRIFWNQDAGCLYDVVGDAPDASMRPNQILAVSLHHSMLDARRAAAVVETVEKELLTPYGLRTLSPRDPLYVPQYEGPPHRRDAAYHQGTVWPWLLGPFVTAYLRVHSSSAAARKRAMQMLLPLEAHLREAGLGQISEIFDGDPPHRPRGCYAQAWSVAEVLRALHACREQVEPAVAQRLRAAHGD